MATEKIYAIGDEIFTECGKCKSEMHHIVTTMKDDKVKKVMCKGCNSTHVFRVKKKKAVKAGAADKPKVKRRSSKKDWGKLTADMQDDEFIDYNMSLDFTQQRGIKHHKFGNGVIIKVLATTQLEVVFQDSIKILVQNYSMN
ncbi:MAG: hypothetical protein DWQ05_21825 [Calditrichaeota bacterium]|nr:MAG: hypothetical protein DWQ05_21825 [Calditrichota bacterium]